MAVLHFLNILKQDTYLMFFILCLFWFLFGVETEVQEVKQNNVPKISSYRSRLSGAGSIPDP